MWSYPTMTVAGGNVGPLPFIDVQFSDSLKDGGAFAGKLPVGHPALTADMRNHLARYITVPCRDGVPFGMFEWTAAPTVGLSEIVRPIQAIRADIATFRRRPVRKDLVFVQVDQHRVARELYRHGLGESTIFTSPPVMDPLVGAGLPWFRLAANLSGVPIDRTKVINGQDDDGYRAKGHKNIHEAVTQLGDNLNGFEPFPTYGVDSTGYFMTMQFGYPKWGTSAGKADRVTFEYPGGNIIDGSTAADAGDFATRVDVVGGEANGAAVIGTATNTAMLAAGYPMRIVTLSETNVTDLAWLNTKAAAELAVRSITKDGYTLTLDGTKEPTLGTYGIGDHVTVRIEAGQSGVLDERVVRIVGWTIQVDNSGESEVVTPTLAEVP